MHRTSFAQDLWTNEMIKPIVRYISAILIATTVAGGLTTARPAAAAKKYKYLSPLALAASRDGNFLYVDEHTGNSIAEVDVNSGGVTRRFGLSDAPTGLALSPLRSKLYVTAGVAEGSVYGIDLSSGEVDMLAPAGHSPTAPIVRPDGSTLYVCSQFQNKVLAFDLIRREKIAEIPVVREPNAAAMTPNGAKLVVINQLPAGPSNADYASAAVSIIDMDSHTVQANIPLPNGSTTLKGVCISPDGAFAYVTHILGRYQLPTTQIEYGWMNTNAVSIINLAQNTVVNTVLLDDVYLGAANPWGITCTTDGKWLCVAHAGTHEISIIDRLALHQKLGRVATAEDVRNDLSFLAGLRRRVRLDGRGPRGLAAVGHRVFAAEYFTDSIGVVNPGSPDGGHAARIALGPEQAVSKVRRGEQLFHDADICFQKWQSCATCHTDARADGLNWDLLNDGMGNPKNTKSLLRAHATPPVMASGVRADAETAVRAGIQYIQFMEGPEEDARAIDAYLKSIKPVPSPFRTDGRLTHDARRGKKVFRKAGCAECHSGRLYTDRQPYNVGTGLGAQQAWEFDTPALIEIWRSAPYLHDGRSATLRDVITLDNPEDRHGTTSDLTDAERDDLIAFLQSL